MRMIMRLTVKCMLRPIAVPQGPLLPQASWNLMTAKPRPVTLQPQQPQPACRVSLQIQRSKRACTNALQNLPQANLCLYSMDLSFANPLLCGHLPACVSASKEVSAFLSASMTPLAACETRVACRSLCCLGRAGPPGTCSAAPASSSAGRLVL